MTDLSGIASKQIDTTIPTPLTYSGGSDYIKEQLQPKIRKTQPTLGRDYLGDKKSESKIEKGIAKSFLPNAPQEFAINEFSPELEGIGAPVLPSNLNLEKAEGIGGKQILESKPEKPISIGESLENSFSNFITTLKTTLPATSIAANQLLGETFDDSILDFLDSLPRVEYGEDGLNLEYKTRDEVLADNLKQLESLKQEYKDTIGFTESIESGNIPRLAAGVVGSISGLLASAVQAGSSGGSLLLTSMVGNSINDYNEKKASTKGITTQQLYDSKQADLKVPAIIGGIGYGLEKLGLKSISKLINEKIAKEGFKKAATLALNWNTEAGTEWLSVGLDAANNSIASGKSGVDVSKDVVDALFSKQGLESYLQGLGASAGATAGGKLIKRVISQSAKKEVADLEIKQNSAINDLKNAEGNPELKDAILESIENNAQKIEEVIDKDRANTAKVTPETKTELEEVSSKLDAISANFKLLLAISKSVTSLLTPCFFGASATTSSLPPSSVTPSTSGWGFPCSTSSPTLASGCTNISLGFSIWKASFSILFSISFLLFS